VLQRAYTIPFAIKNAQFDEKTIEWQRFKAYAMICKQSWDSNTTPLKKLIKRFLVHDYDISKFSQDYIQESLDSLENL
jgi:hypothetical protein